VLYTRRELHGKEFFIFCWRVARRQAPGRNQSSDLVLFCTNLLVTGQTWPKLPGFEEFRSAETI
jgi:hypothetical protein